MAIYLFGSLYVPLLKVTVQVQRGCEYCPRSHSQEGIKWKFKPKSVWSQNLGSFYFIKFISDYPKHKRNSCNAMWNVKQGTNDTVNDFAWGGGRKPPTQSILTSWVRKSGDCVCIALYLCLYFYFSISVSMSIYYLVSQLLSSLHCVW